MADGYLCLVLHCHLPFIRHPEHQEFLEEDWFFEAVTETYIPVLRALERLVSEGMKPRITMSVTPPLSEMMVDPTLQERCAKYIAKRKELAEKEAVFKKGSPFEEAAYLYRDMFSSHQHYYEVECGRQLLPRFRRLQEQGVIEIITCGATHGFLPLMIRQSSVYAQIEIACRNYEKHFGRRPRGIWLPECAYMEGLDKVLKSCGIEFFFLESHGLLLADPPSVYGVFAPILCPAGTAAFGRDVESSKEVWSSQEGYPGDYWYRDFYRDLGYDGAYEYVQPYLHADGHRRHIGLKYHRVTGNVPLGAKEPYIPSMAGRQAETHARDFMEKRIRQCQTLRGQIGREPIIVAPYDAELFGHWWFEGPWFIEHLFRAIHGQNRLEAVTPPMYLDRHYVLQVAQPSPSSWGDKGYYEVWLNGSNHWIYRHIHTAEQRMAELAHANPDAEGLRRRALNQAARELLLMQSSDWAFLMTTGTAHCYATRRTNLHIDRFNRIYQMLRSGDIDEGWLNYIEFIDSIFQEIDYRVYGR